jgi:hypothetical protein
MMKTNCIKFICGLALLGAVSQVSATPVVYTMTSHLTGSLGGTDFTDAFVTLTTTADTTNIWNGTDIGFGYLLLETTTIQIDGLNLATFNGDMAPGATHPCGVWSVDLAYSSIGLVGFVHPNSGGGYEYILAVATPVPPIYDLSTPYTLTGEGALMLSEEGQVLFSYEIRNGEEEVASFSTDQGDLVIAGTSGVTTFTAAVPEPASAMMLIFGAGIGLAVHRARRSALRR